MSLFDVIFKNRPKPAGRFGGSFELLDAYSPHFRRYEGSIYESELVRSAIHARATHISKLSVEMVGAARPSLQNKLKHGPNQFQTWGQFLYLLSTRLDVYNTAFICPIYDDFGEPSGIFCPLAFAGGDQANFINGCIGIAIGFVVAFVTTWLFGLTKEQAEGKE